MHSTGTGEQWRRLSSADVERAVLEVKGSAELPAEIYALIGRSLSVRTHRDMRFQVSRRRLGLLGVAALVVPEIRFEALPYRPANTVHLAVVTAGGIELLSRENRALTLQPGDVCLISNWSLVDVQSTHSTRLLHVTMPESRLRERGLRVPPGGFRLDGDASLVSPLVALLDSVLEPGWEPTGAAARIAERAIESLAVGILLGWGGMDADSEAQRGEFRRRALEEIAARHRDPKVNPAQLARYLGVSLRHLQRGFEHSGTTVAEQLTQHRVETAADLLTAAGSRAPNLAHVAHASGFGSAFELRSAFRARYGVLPSEYRSNPVPRPR